jgi:GNAT superfamily N-acetyltransferase
MLMSAVAGDPGTSISAQVTRRWQAADPLLPAPGALPPGCGAALTVTGADGHPAAVGTCAHWEGEPESLDLTWGAARRFRLTPWLAGPDIPGALDRLLSLWREHLTDVPGAGDEDTAAVVTWPSRDIDGVGTLLRRGFAPLGVVAARTTDRHSATAGAPPAGATERAGVRIRRAGPADVDAVVRLGLETIRFDAHFGGVIERPGTAKALWREAAGLLAGPEPWTWLAERDGAPLGMVYAERPEAAGWIAPMVRLAPVAYLTLMVVLPGERGGGVGTALAARLHGEISAAGVPVTLLHYEQTNPLSAPFWGQQGYRPLWTSWEARPALVIR